MSDPNVLVVIGSASRKSSMRPVLQLVVSQLQGGGCPTDLLDLAETPLSLFNPDTTYHDPGYSKLQARVEAADVLILGTPDYHGSMSSALKNFLDHFWKEYAGKLFVSVVASHDKGLTVADQVRTVARQTYGWALPYAVTFAENTDVKDGAVINESFAARLQMMVRDVRVYGGLLAQQRAADLSSPDACFMARYRKP